jgi:hypothetical protein
MDQAGDEPQGYAKKIATPMYRASMSAAPRDGASKAKMLKNAANGQQTQTRAESTMHT